MPTEKRQRQKEGHQARKEAAQAQARRQARKRRLISLSAIVVVFLAIMLIISLVSDDDSTDVTAGDDTETSEMTTTTLDITKPDVTVPPAAATEMHITDLVEGDGEEAKLGDTIEVHYVGKKQSDGSEFDASWDGAPITFELVEGGLIEGWIEGIPGMKVGGRRELVIPEDLAYRGEQEPTGTLVFVVDLISIK